MAYYRKKLHFLGRQISSNIELKPQQVQEVFKKDSLDGVKGEYLTSTFQPFFENKFMQINDLEFFFEEARDFAKSEMDLGKDYFKSELCGVKRLLFQVIDYYTQSPKNMSSTHLYHGDAIPLSEQQKLTRFFKTYFKLDTEKFNCYQAESDKVELIKLILGLIFEPEEVEILLGKTPEDFNPTSIE